MEMKIIDQNMDKAAAECPILKRNIQEWQRELRILYGETERFAHRAFLNEQYQGDSEITTCAWICEVGVSRATETANAILERL